MATAAQSISTTPSLLSWFEQFLKDELSPYPGRTALVARMVIAATLVMMICMVFRIPLRVPGSDLCTHSFSREFSGDIQVGCIDSRFNRNRRRVSLGLGLVRHQHTDAASSLGHSFIFSGILRDQHLH